jgi:MSHA biogenesis protein MshJ
VQFLKRRPGLRLVSSGTVANEAGAADAAHVPGVQRRGLELKVAGPYPELTRYVQSLEQALPHLRWGTMQLAVDTQGPELTLLVYVLEVAP